MLFGLAALMTASLAEKTAEEFTKPSKLSDCAKYGKDWLIAQCAASLKQRDLISKTTFNHYLHLSIQMDLKETVEYNSIGYVTGPAPGLLLGHQKNPHFNWAYRLPADPRNMYHGAMYYDNLHAVDKPILMYLSKAVDGVPELITSMPASYHPSGKGHAGMVRVYRYGAIESGEVKEGCDAFGQWKYLDSAKTMVGSAIIMPRELWCPKASSAFLVIYGEFEKHDLAASGLGNLIVPNWQFGSDEKHHLNTAGKKTVF